MAVRWNPPTEIRQKTGQLTLQVRPAPTGVVHTDAALGVQPLVAVPPPGQVVVTVRVCVNVVEPDDV
jgi:hypothetical protein